MDYKISITINLSPGLIELLDISKDTVFEAYYDDGQIVVNSLTEKELKECITGRDEHSQDICKEE